MGRSFLAALWLFAWFVTPGFGQAAKTDDSADVLVVDHDFAAVGELVRIFLQDKQVYRVELSSIDVTLEIRPRFHGMPVPRVYPIFDSQTPSGSSVFEIHPDRDGEYEIRPVSIQGSRISTHVRIYRDLDESARRVGERNQPGWDLGIEIAGGWHSGYQQSNSAPVAGSSPDGGTDLEACVSARNPPKVRRLSMCILGLGHQSQPGAPSIFWIYTEPRISLLGSNFGLSHWEAGVSLRFGMGINSGSNVSPSAIAPGLFVARHFRSNPDGSGWSLQASYRRSFFRFRVPSSVPGGGTPESNRVSVGFGWYR
jgi:hypothetical protein